MVYTSCIYACTVTLQTLHLTIELLVTFGGFLLGEKRKLRTVQNNTKNNIRYCLLNSTQQCLALFITL